MAQILQINPSGTSIGERECFAGISAQTNVQLPVKSDAFAIKRLESELNEHRYYLEQKVEQRTEQLIRRITLLESCNATLCNKLAQAKRDVAALHKQLANAQLCMESDDLVNVVPNGAGAS
ncbi:MAG: hypothetical protein A3J49_01945 [Gallionellales bacterium RIFCSPHIGHO2_02_FULL_57_16]|nr:MAG: hypothetical protein A3J49_01945 [Gallionellales bacterium RIFCSPHIGHO2_02_FULL_57_16]